MSEQVKEEAPTNNMGGGQISNPENKPLGKIKKRKTFKEFVGG